MSLSWLTGPIFEKELRVSSRRRRNYILRFVYLAFLTGVVAMIWVRVIGRGGSGLNLVSRMSEAGKAVVAYTVWFQFIATQVVAVVMLSTSISDEIYNRTLGMLMTTPISSFQIVMGKLCSKLLQLILLLAISLPVLAVVRVFGGVPWNYVVSSLFITLTTIIFVGSVSLFFSIFTRKAYVVIIVTFLTLGVLFALLPLGVYAVWDITFTHTNSSEKSLMFGLFLPNPYCNMFFNTIVMTNPRARGVPMLVRPLHCGIMLAASALILLVSMVSVRRVALSQVAGDSAADTSKKRRRRKGGAPEPGPERPASAARRVVGPAVLWKEMRLPILGRRRRTTFLVAGLALVVVLGSYVLFAAHHALDDPETHIVYAIVYLGLGILFTVVLASTCITAEKEARSWPLLLATTLDNRDILFGKFVGTLRRSLPVWMLLLGHTIVFTLTGDIHPIAILHMGILVLWVVLFLSCSGLYFGSRFKHTTTAVIMNFAFAFALWAVLPVILLLASIFTNSDDLIQYCMDTNPLVHVAVAVDAATGKSAPNQYWWPGSHGGNVWDATVWMLICMVGYVLFGALMAWRAQSRFRRNIF